MMSKTALIPITNGTESLEVVTLINVLRRGGVSVTVASIESELNVLGTLDVPLKADVLFKNIASQEFDLIALPGGTVGAENFSVHKPLIEKLHAQRMAHKWYGAICATPALALSPHGLLDGKQATCYPMLRDKLIHYVDQPVVVDGHCITSQGPATSMAFGIKLVEILCGAETSKQVAQGLLA